MLRRLASAGGIGGARCLSAAALGYDAGFSSALRDKVFLVTGSTDGIGLHTSHLLAQNGATVLVHGR